MVQIEIAGRIIGENYPSYIIAEIGINHQGREDLALELIKAASDCGADAVKFQKRTISRILSREGLEMPYTGMHSFGKTYGEHKKVLELSDDTYRKLFKFAGECGVHFLASGWDEESIDFLCALGVPAVKIASADLTNIPLLEHTAAKGLPILVSTGMADMDDVHKGVEAVSSHGAKPVIMQCVSTYPAEFEDINLNVLRTYRKEFPECVIGYSGHEKGIAIPVAAVALGARIVERHFTLDRTMKGGDHSASLEPQGFSKMVRDIRATEKALGNGEKKLLEVELPVRKKLAKSIVTAQYVASGTTLTADLLTTKGPGTGLSPQKMKEVIGKKAVRNIPADTVVTEKDILWD
jgi:sialic acid synthase